MKKLLSIGLATMMLIMSIGTTVFAEGSLKEKTFSAVDDIYNNKEGEGFHHNSSAAGKSGLEVNGTNVVLRQQEWICYDVSDFESGVYDLTFKAGVSNEVPITVSIDGVNVISEYNLPTTGGYNTIKDEYLGQIELSGSHQKIKFLNTHRSRYIYVAGFTLKKIDPLKLETVTYNVGEDGGLIPAGADEITLGFSAELDKDTVNNENIFVKNENGDIILAQVRADGKNAIISLKEALQYGSTYTIYADSIKAESGADLDGAVEKTFETAESTVKEGNATLEVTSFSTENGVVTAEGIVKSSQGLGIKGRNVILYIENEDGVKVEEVEAASETDGAFKITCEMDANAQAGRYDVTVTSDYVEDAYENYFMYFSESLNIEIKEAFTNLPDSESVETQVNKYTDYLGVDMVWAENAISDFSKVYEKLTGLSFENAEEVIESFKGAVYFEAIVQAKNAEDAEEILEDSSKTAYLTGFDESMWNELSADGKTVVAGKAADYEGSEISGLAAFINDEVKAQLVLQYGLSASEISFTSDEVFTGEEAEIVASFENAAENVCAIHFEFEYDEKGSELLKAENVKVTAIDGMTASVSNVENKLYIDLKAETSVDLSLNDSVNIAVFAPGTAGGTHKPKVSGYVSHKPDEMEAGNSVSIEFNVSSSPVIKVNEITEFETDIDKVIERTEGIGFHDEPASGGSVRGLETSGTSVCIRAGEWTAYDISKLAAGEYEVSLAYTSTGILEMGVAIDDTKQLNKKNLPASGSYSTRITNIVGTVKLDGNQKVLKLYNDGTSATYAAVLYLIRIEDLAISDYSTNVEKKDDSTVSRGADRFTVEFTNELDSKAITEENVKFKKEDGTELPVNVSVSGKNIIIDLKETLDFDKAYKIEFANVKDRFGQISSTELAFTTAGDEWNEGISSIEFDTWKVSGRKFTAEGTVLTSAGVGIAGRDITISVKSANESDYKVWMEGTSKTDGKFTLTYNFTDSQPSGTYSAEVQFEYGRKVLKSIYYFDDELNKSLAEEFSYLANAEDVANKLREHSEEMGINIDAFEVDTYHITKNMTNKKYNTATEVLEEVNKRYALEKANQCLTAQNLVDIIDDENELKEIGEIERDKWNVLTPEEKEKIAQEIKNANRIEEPAELLEVIDEKINKVMQERYSLVAANVSASEDSVSVGNEAEILITASEKQENVVKIHLEFAYTDNEAKLLESNPQITLSKDLRNLEVSAKVENNKLIYDIYTVSKSNVLSKTSFRNDIATITFKAAEGTEGTYAPIFGGYITYLADSNPDNQIKAYSCDVPFNVTAQPKITVNASQAGSNNNDYVSGGRPGGSGYGTSGSKPGGSSGGASGGAVKPTVPATTNEGLHTEPAFNDLDGALWAKDSIEAMATKGIISGRGDGSFAPNDNVTRAEFCKMITLAFDVVNDNAVCEFNDVSTEDWYYVYVASAKEKGYINGKTDNLFAPNDTITREEMAAISLRALGIEQDYNTGSFADDESISPYAKAGVYKLKELGILDGVGNNLFAPHMNVTRAMAAKVIYKLMLV